MASRSCLYVFLLLLAFQSVGTKANIVLPPPQCRTFPAITLDRMQFLTNLLVLKAEWCLRSSVDRGINDISPGLVEGPITTGATVAVLDDSTRRIIEEFGLATVGHLKAIANVTLLNPPFLTPQLNLTKAAFFSVLFPSNFTFDIYASQNAFLIAVELITSIITQYVTYLVPLIIGDNNQQLIAGISLTTAAQNGVIRSRLNAAVNVTVPPLTITVADLTSISAAFRNGLGLCGVKDEGLVVPLALGAEGRTTSNVVVGDMFSLGFARNELEVLRILFGSGNASLTGGVFPAGILAIFFRVILN